jgi:hypothetical protein
MYIYNHTCTAFLIQAHLLCCEWVCFVCCAEVGYNHYCGRKGLQMPQTAALLSKCRPEGYVHSLHMWLKQGYTIMVYGAATRHSVAPLSGSVSETCNHTMLDTKTYHVGCQQISAEPVAGSTRAKH